ncbi:hypothetical protein TNCT_296771 [Trichonephila clavata]|uniref:Uncharacterized protein n=1 Tax=Trichonephila clavata TaxID=2740835 RepID=A0A8X6M579_TRICU|nr:hypothetical protein TNCT_296771 [Trichonephila clavata]
MATDLSAAVTMLTPLTIQHHSRIWQIFQWLEQTLRVYPIYRQHAAYLQQPSWDLKCAANESGLQQKTVPLRRRPYLRRFLKSKIFSLPLAFVVLRGIDMAVVSSG